MGRSLRTNPRQVMPATVLPLPNHKVPRPGKRQSSTCQMTKLGSLPGVALMISTPHSSTTTARRHGSSVPPLLTSRIKMAETRRHRNLRQRIHRVPRRLVKPPSHKLPLMPIRGVISLGRTLEPQTRSTSVSPTKASRANSKKTRQPKSQPDVITIEDSSDEEVFSWTGRKTQANPAAVDSPQAMDIDPPQEPVVEQAPVHEARNIPVEPSRPEWRPGDFGARAGSAGSKKSPETTVNANAAGSEDSEEFKASLADLSKVAPFAQQASGLKSFKDMKDHLPFESKASDEVFDKGDKDITRLAFPQIPVAPRPSPSFAVEGIKPTASAWQKYAAEFETYLRQWSEFNSSVIDHFEARRSNLVASRAANGYDFLRARGDEGCAEYLKAVSQDNDVRRRWNEACENHEERLREFMTFRAKMK
uniref:Uncharacterized protein n=1 Tax=Bionectria ochroleuca TaxID=29856 RepID=A0A8H7NPC0_BIOOC